MSDFTSSVQWQFKQFDRQLQKNNFLNALESRTNVPKSYLVSGFTFVYLLLTFLNVGGIGQILSNFVGFVLPTVHSINAIKTKTKDDDTKLLAYWIIFSFLNVIEFWSSAILYLIPFYYFIKIVFLVYIGTPSTGGAVLLWNKFIEPVYDRSIGHFMQTNDIRSAVDNAEEAMATGASRHIHKN
ncbi:hypothetical protein KAFR_0K02090 [Kazachstania africana CBS 2517]|uniref:Protein YOP1 n=1 Tax=Kazachstania africana (strain ATCC 22294 / BCRC 22015 / CBS 2517 / CECT 1963 / NBRC 1671 / NRRL Y-8276) TaxID=1071382 RepID=H2B1R3_KAZAF|nr:hypothetical protein KAFR_0K02090 [Kazachstania africana CBS 2517]CCF60563.1 hypothetical protein KAFR_0K02090 [Kazachstania africana CBS 2517]